MKNETKKTEKTDWKLKLKKIKKTWPKTKLKNEKKNLTENWN